MTIADILAMESEVILFDEPAASLDPMGEERLEAVLGRLSDEGRTLVISTHDMDFAFRWATRAVVFAGGQVIADGVPDAVFRDAETLLRAAWCPQTPCARARPRGWRRCWTAAALRRILSLFCRIL